MIRKDIIIFTGQSGIKIDKCVAKLSNLNSNHRLEILKVEKEMIEKYQQMYPNNNDNDKQVVRKILSLAPQEQRKLWNQSFESILRKIQKQISGKIYFLLFHACFYHQKHREFLSPIDLLALKKLSKRTKMIIVFVDDCYDIYKRLLEHGEIFYEDIFSPQITPREAMIKSIWNLLTILYWREIEIAFSRKIAEVLKIPIFIVPVKNPSIMIQRLIYFPLRSLKIFYLAHPITSIRKRTYARTAQFPQELNEFAKNCISKNKNFILFLPDTIDELRIEQKNGLYVPKLSAPWPLPFNEDEWLYHPLSNSIRNIEPIDPKQYGKINKMTSDVIRILAQKIDEQITSRDYALVEQSKHGIIIYQPYWEGDISGGASKEAKYNYSLRCKKNIRRTYILEKKENLGKYRIKELFTELTRVLKKVDDNLKHQLENMRQNWQKDTSIVEKFYKGTYLWQNLKSEIEKILPPDYDFNDNFLSPPEYSLRGVEIHEKDQRLNSGWQKLCDSVLKLDPFRKLCYNPADEYWITSSIKFNRQLRKFLCMFKKNRRKK